MKSLEKEALSLPNAAIAELMKAVLEKGGAFCFRARGASMAPFLKDGDKLTIAPLALHAAKPGDVLAYSHLEENESRLVVHRVVGRQGTNLVVQGDGKGCTPEEISQEDVLGKLIKVERDGRRIRLGMGPERGLIAWANRSGLLWNVFWPLWCRFKRLSTVSKLCKPQ